MSNSHHNASPSRSPNRSPLPTNTPMPTFPFENQQQQSNANDELNEASGIEFAASAETMPGQVDWEDRSISGSQLESDVQRVSVQNIQRNPSASSVSIIGSRSVSSPTGSKEILSNPQSKVETSTFSSYFGDNDAVQQDNDIFVYDYSSHYPSDCVHSQDYATGTNEPVQYQNQEPYLTSTQYEQNYQEENFSHYFSSDNRQSEESGYNQNAFPDYYSHTENCNQETQFINNSNQNRENLSQYWDQTEYSSESQFHENYSQHYNVHHASAYQQAGQNNFYTDSNQDTYNYQYEGYNIDHNHQYYHDVPDDSTFGQSTLFEAHTNSTFDDIELDGPSTRPIPNIQYPARLKRQNPFRPPEPHPVVSFAFGGKMLFGLIRTSFSGNRSLMQDVEVRVWPGKMRLCTVLSVIRNTALERSIKDFPGPISSSSNITAVCQKQLSLCHRNELLWKLVDILACNKGSWNAEKVTTLLTHTTNRSDTWLSSSSSSCTAPCIIQPPASLKANNEDVLHFQSLVTTGKHVEAADFAASKGLWSHALIISLNCEAKIHSSIIQRYRDSFLVPGSQLHTVYSSLAGCPIRSTESWKENLAALFNTPRSSLTIFQLGELLLAEKNTDAAHVCFLLSGRLEKLSLLGLQEQTSKIFQCPCPDAVQLTECFEHSVRQKDSSFNIEALVYAKCSYACLLIDLGLNNSAFRYIHNVLRCITELTKAKRHVFSEQFCYAVKVVDHQLSQIASGNTGLESSGVLGSIFNNISKLLIGKEEIDTPVPTSQPKVINVPHIERRGLSTIPEPPKNENVDDDNAHSELPKDGSIISKLTGFFRSRNPSPNGDLAQFEEEEKFEWDPVTKKWISNLTGPPKPVERPLQETVPIRPPPPRPNASVTQPSMDTVRRTDLNSRYALDERQHSLSPQTASSTAHLSNQPLYVDVNASSSIQTSSDSSTFTRVASIRPSIQHRFQPTSRMPRLLHRPLPN